MRIKFILIVLLQFILLVSITGYRQYWVYAGEKVLLKTAPVDPRSLFRGDYVRLRYNISSLDTGELPGDDDFSRNDTIYVVLGKNYDGTYEAASLSITPPEDWLFIKGRVTSAYGGRLNVKYGIESFFVEEGKGLDIEAARGTQELLVEVSLLDSGKATISSLIMDGKRLK